VTTSPSLPLPLNLTEETAPHPSTPSMMGGRSLICSVGYAAYTTTPAFQEGILRLEKIGHEARTAFLCAERLPWRCHRRFIGDELARRGWTVLHLIGEGKGIMAVPR